MRESRPLLGPAGPCDPAQVEVLRRPGVVPPTGGLEKTGHRVARGPPLGGLLRGHGSQGGQQTNGEREDDGGDPGKRVEPAQRAHGASLT